MFKEVGHLNYAYVPGLFVPLRDGKVLALDGMRTTSDGPEKLFQAEDGNKYGYGVGMIELFDPSTQQCKVLTKMPFWFYQLTHGQQQMRAVELLDGRILMVGKFLENPTPTVYKYSNVQHGIAPMTEPNMFGLIYDLHKNTFEIVRTSEDIPPRLLTTLNVLPDGQVLIIGGSISRSWDVPGDWQQYQETRVLLFQPDTNKLTVCGHLQHGRYGHQTLQISKTKFMLFGGWGPSKAESKEIQCVLRNPDGTCALSRPQQRTREVEVFDLATGKSEIIGHTLTSRWGFSAIPCFSGKVLIHGGIHDAQGLGYWCSELFDPETGASKYIGEDPRIPGLSKITVEQEPYDLPGEGDRFKAIRANDEVLMAGMFAYTYHEHDFDANGRLKETPYRGSLLMPREIHELVKTANGRILVMGGEAFNYSDQGPRFLGRAYLIEEFVGSKLSTQSGE